MDITPFLDLRIAPRAVFDSLAERRTRVRFMIPVAPAGGTIAQATDYRSVTWGAFADEIREIALYASTVLGDTSARTMTTAAIYAGNRVEWASAALAIQAAGGAMVPIYPASTPEQVGYVASHCDARLLFVDGAALFGRLLTVWSKLEQVERIVLLDDALDIAKVHESLRAKGVAIPSFGEVEAKVVTWSRARTIGAAMHREDPARFERTMHAVSLDHVGMMLYTSGTSGMPKGVPLTHRNVAVNGLDWLKSNAPLLGEGDVDVLWLPMSHIFGFGEMCLGNTLGWTSYLYDPVTCLAVLPAIKPTIFMSVPSHWEKLASMAMHEPTPEARLAAFQRVTGGRLRFCLSGGAGLKREVKEFFHSCGVLVIEGYGLTETSPTLTLNRPDAFRFDTVGKPFPTVELKLADDGEILARGPNVFSGYHKDPEATAACFTSDGWFMTGDVGRFTDDGFLQIVDRKKDILVTAGGKNVPPANIEMRFRDDPLVTHVVVYGDAKKFLVAGFWLDEGAVSAALEGTPASEREAAKRALVQKRVDRVNESLASFETIKKFAIVSEPLTVEGEMLTASMKLRRKKVYDRFRDVFEDLYQEPHASSAPRPDKNGGTGAEA